jgi:putative heme-binding domain-containing protein
VKLKGNRVISGIVKQQDASSVTLVNETGEVLTIPRGDITLMKQQNGISMMPEGLISAMPPDDIRALAVYLRSPRQVPNAGDGTERAEPVQR